MKKKKKKKTPFDEWAFTFTNHWMKREMMKSYKAREERVKRTQNQYDLNSFDVDVVLQLMMAMT